MSEGIRPTVLRPVRRRVRSDRGDDAIGDRDLVRSCPPMEAYESA
jgi:hypothetical protein